MQDRAEIVHQNFLRRVAAKDLPDTALLSPSEAGLSPEAAVQIFESQVLSRQLDIISRKLQARGEGFYTIGSSGHEGNAATAHALRLSDMAFLHYRGAAFFIERAKQLPGSTPLWDMLLSFAASSEDPISGGRHKVIGSKELYIPPQTSTIASHLPKAVGAAYSIGLNRKLGQEGQLPRDAIIACSFGDASLNHSTAQGAINTACWTAYQDVPMPLLFLCEDNDIGISTATPHGWVKESVQARPALEYFYCDGLNLFEAHKAASEAANFVRKKRKPAFLHFKCVRLYGHAGADMQTAYMSKQAVEAMEAQDPLLHSAHLLIANNILSESDVLDIYNSTEQRLTRAAERTIQRPKFLSAPEVMDSIIPSKKEVQTLPVLDEKTREVHFGRDWEALQQPQHMARLITFALHDLMLQYPQIICAGEDIGPKGGVYNVTAKLHQKFGAHRVINTLLDEQSILGLAIGMGHNDILPIPEIQFLAYLHNAEDQIRGEAATLSFFSSGKYTNPMVIRIAGLAYQRGFGGHFHNDNSFNVLRDIPGVIVACPSNGADAVEMLRECVRLAHEEQRVVVFLEPIALYMTRDLHAEKDGGWMFDYPAPQEKPAIGFGALGQYGDGKELAILSYGNGFYLSRQAVKILEEDHKIKLRIIDLRWLCPLNKDAIKDAVKGCKHILIVDECRETGSVSEELMTLLHDHENIARITATDSFIPLGKAYASTLPSKDSIIDAALDLTKKAKRKNAA